MGVARTVLIGTRSFDGEHGNGTELFGRREGREPAALIAASCAASTAGSRDVRSRVAHVPAGPSGECASPMCGG